MEALLDPKLKYSGKVCRKLPVSVSHNGTFIVDVLKLKNPSDVDFNDLGVWRNNRVDTVFFHARISERGVSVVDSDSVAVG